jgi:hypothetical protein
MPKTAPGCQRDHHSSACLTSILTAKSARQLIRLLARLALPRHIADEVT